MSNVNRRTFLASAGSGAAALALASGARAAGPNDQLRVAVVGLRGRGESHVQGFSDRKDTAVVALCDVDSSQFPSRAKEVEQKTGKTPQLVGDLRHLMEDKSIDIISIATPNHWHALAAVWACQAGKDVYVEKPVSHNVSEGRKIVEAANKYGRVVQTGTQSRSSAGVQEAIDFLKSGKLGKIFLARGLCFKWRTSIGQKADAPVPAGVDYNVWLGPAPERPFNPNRFHYEWHWNWDYGNGDIGNQGIHQMDVARWGLGKNALPTQIQASGGRFGYKDDGETPNTLLASYRYDDCQLEFEVRGLPTNDEKGVRVGNIFYGPEGYLTINGDKWASFFVSKDGKKEEVGPSGRGGGDHFGNFVKAVQSRKPELLNAEILEGHLSSALCHLGNISYRLGRAVTLDPQAENFGPDEAANALLTREYRSPFTMPAKV
ncbi:MAG TPA: Gfo/Idh/MocA family oxidoreductase [Isosphaeraceae bacterium]|jgi:predicted dehydrogenase|nr:Gfo/Idh/MocA family oxidoreductase [Isosphaeraceae bacterium]